MITTQIYNERGLKPTNKKDVEAFYYFLLVRRISLVF